MAFKFLHNLVPLLPPNSSLSIVSAAQSFSHTHYTSRARTCLAQPFLPAHVLVVHFFKHSFFHIQRVMSLSSLRQHKSLPARLPYHNQTSSIPLTSSSLFALQSCHFLKSPVNVFGYFLAYFTLSAQRNATHESTSIAFQDTCYKPNP